MDKDIQLETLKDLLKSATTEAAKAALRQLIAERLNELKRSK